MIVGWLFLLHGFVNRYKCKHCSPLLNRQLTAGGVQDRDRCITVEAGEGPEHLVAEDLELGVVIFGEGNTVPGLVIISCKSPHITIHLNTIVQK